MDRLRVNAFGKLRMQLNGSELTAFPTRHVEELLGYLLLHPNVLHNREKLIEMLWPTTHTTNVKARFSTVLWRLRKSFDAFGIPAAACLDVSRQAVCFVPPADWSFDVHDFQTALKQLRNTSLDENAREAALQRAVSCYHGELLDGVYANWCLLERERLARQYLRAAGQLMLSLMRREAFEDALVYGQEILAQDPLREEVHRAVMFCYWKTGQYAFASEQYQACAKLLQDELRTLPRPATVDLYQKIMADRFAIDQDQLAAGNPAHVQLQHAFDEFQLASQRLNRMLGEIEAQTR